MKVHAILALIVLSIIHDVQSESIYRTLRNIFFGSSDKNLVSDGDCSIDIRTELNRTASGTVREPLFLKYSGNEYKLMIPNDDGELKFKAGESALIACTSDQKANTLTLNNKQSSTILCLQGNNFNINNEKHSVSEFNECSSQINGNALNRNQKCAGDGSLISIGFQLNDGRGFVSLIDVCYNKKTGSSIYARHVLQGNAIKNAMKSSTRPSGFKTSEVPSKIDAPKSFTKAKQLSRFEEIFGSEEKAKEYLDKTYLARGHLAPDGDFLFVSWQFTTYYYINTIPQWQSINNANWKHVESVTRSKADKLNEDLIIFTGGFEVLKLNNKKIMLEPDGLEVPKWSWKVVKVPSDNSGIAFVTYNNPFATSAPTALCQDICNANGWDWKERRNFSKGHTVCCQISDLMNSISSIPSEARASKILEK